MATLPTLSLLLSSQEARDAAPCVAVSRPWVLHRNGELERPRVPQLIKPSGEYWVSGYHCRELDIIWSGDLPALLAAMVAEAERMSGALNNVKSLAMKAQHDGGPNGIFANIEDFSRHALKGHPND